MYTFSNVIRPQSPQTRSISPPNLHSQTPPPLINPIAAVHRPVITPVTYVPIEEQPLYYPTVVRKNPYIPSSYNSNRGNVYYDRRRVNGSGSDWSGSRSGSGSSVGSQRPVRIVRVGVMGKYEGYSKNGNDFYSPVKARVNIRYVSPQSINPRPQEVSNIINTKTSIFTFGQPKKPSILTQKKPGIKRMNSQPNSPNHNPFHSPKQYKIHVYYDKSQAPNSKNTQTYSIYQKNLTGNATTTAPNYSMQQVNMTPTKKDMENSAMNMERVEEHIYEEEHKIANLLAEELQLHYDYFRGGDKSDRSISNHVSL